MNYVQFIIYYHIICRNLKQYHCNYESQKSFYPKTQVTPVWGQAFFFFVHGQVCCAKNAAFGIYVTYNPKMFCLIWTIQVLLLCTELLILRIHWLTKLDKDLKHVFVNIISSLWSCTWQLILITKENSYDNKININKSDL